MRSRTRLYTLNTLDALTHPHTEIETFQERTVTGPPDGSGEDGGDRRICVLGNKTRERTGDQEYVLPWDEKIPGKDFHHRKSSNSS